MGNSGDCDDEGGMGTYRKWEEARVGVMVGEGWQQCSLLFSLKFFSHSNSFQSSSQTQILFLFFSDTNLDANQLDYAQTAHASGKDLIALINEVLDQAKIESGRLELEAVPFDLRADLDKV
ncbi:hypothetical protein ACH5RR_009043 [Cinchona calisaya]|uniref:histidine kinase n=1 Tax=Cinchona calisaya TaxID=153742 RepID=A0ABD3AFJ1_9GENT